MERIFISYSHQDSNWLKLFQKHLKPYLRDGEIVAWDDTQIRSGQKWKQAIDQALDATRVALFLVTPDFLASDFINDVELPSLLQAAESRSVNIVWVAVRHAAYHKASHLTDYQCANKPDKPLASLPSSERDKVLTEICEEIVNYLGNPQ